MLDNAATVEIKLHQYDLQTVASNRLILVKVAKEGKNLQLYSQSMTNADNIALLEKVNKVELHLRQHSQSTIVDDQECRKSLQSRIQSLQMIKAISKVINLQFFPLCLNVADFSYHS